MKRVTVWLLAAVASATSVDSSACRIEGSAWPTLSELAASSEHVFIAHVDRVQPLSDRDAQSIYSFFSSDAQPGVPFTFPTAAADFSLLRTLKGAPVASGSVLRSAMQNCSGIALEAGSDYMIFANGVGSGGGDIAPLKGSFKLYDTSNVLAGLKGLSTRAALAKIGDIADQADQAEHREIQARIHSQPSMTP